MSPSADAALPTALRAVAADPATTDRFLAGLAGLVAIRSGTGDATGIGRVAGVLAEALGTLGAEVALRRDGDGGPTLVAVLRGRAPGARIALVGHLDTVGAPDDADPRLLVRDGRALGRGAVDMKGGLQLIVAALEAMGRVAGSGGGPLAAGELLVIMGPDEEVGSPSGRVAMRELVPGCGAALVLEPGRPTGALVAARKGMLQARVAVQGRAAHAGVEPEAGRSALLAAAHATIALHALTGMGGGEAGVTVNVGTLRGGSRPNVVPDAAVLELDLRAATVGAMADAEAEVRRIVAAPAVPDVTMELVETGRFPVMERLRATDALLARVAGVAALLGLGIEGVATGGASDANLIASLGVPVLDGLGPVGGGMHGPDEWLDIRSLPDRIALLAGSILELPGG